MPRTFLAAAGGFASAARSCFRSFLRAFFDAARSSVKNASRPSLAAPPQSLVQLDLHARVRGEQSVETHSRKAE